MTEEAGHIKCVIRMSRYIYYENRTQGTFKNVRKEIVLQTYAATG